MFVLLKFDYFNYETGDWGLQRQGAIYMEGTEDCIISSNTLVRLEGNAISINRYNRNLTIYRNEIVWNGDTGITVCNI